MHKGLKSRPDPSATASATVRAKRLESPGTKVSKVAFLFRWVCGSSDARC
jgi:hypothetical protein